MELKMQHGGFALLSNGQILFEHSHTKPALFIGQGHARIDSYRGNFDIEDYLESRIALKYATVMPQGNEFSLQFSSEEGLPTQITLTTTQHSNGFDLTFTSASESINRVWLRLPSTIDEKVYGCGEQMSFLNLKGHHFPLWTSEPGVGRDKTSDITFKADVMGKAGGDYYHTNYPQPTFISSKHYSCHVETTAYADFDFRHAQFHELQIWAVPQRVELRTARSFLDLIEQLSLRFGRQPALPEWVYNGVILGLKGGEQSTFSRLENAIAHGVNVSALWSEDWVGLRVTSFGKRLFWDWKWNPLRYPTLDKRIADLAKHNIRFMAYINPYLCKDGSLFPIAQKNGYLALNGNGEAALVDFGEFDCGIVDFTIPAACQWFKDEVIKKNLLDLGISGWMADFGEYLPTEDVYLANGIDATLMHNAWPVLWAQVNAEAIAEAGKTDDVTFFMRAGYSGVQRYCPLLWAGDQSVDFSRHDGLNTVITGALSSGLLGNAYHHSDIGGYTSLFGNRRTQELFERWTDMAAFTPVMRTHEGNRPDENFQFDHSNTTLAHLARMTRIYKHLVPYLKTLVAQAQSHGYPIQRPLFVHFEHDPNTYDIQDHYLYGADLLVAPVHQANVSEWKVYLPIDEYWVHVWSGQVYRGGQYVTIAAPIGQPPVFYRQGSTHQSLFDGLKML